MAKPFFAAENKYSGIKLCQNRLGFDHAVREKLAMPEYTIHPVPFPRIPLLNKRHPFPSNMIKRPS